jgi:DNA adenine methylase
MIKSPLRYPGGKSKAIKKLSEFTDINFKEYREPFVGGGSLFIYLKQCFPDRQFWINDLNTDVYSFWKAAQENLAEMLKLIKKFKKEKNGKALYQKLLAMNLGELSLIERGARFFVLNRITFSGTTESGGFSERAFQGRFTDSSIDRVAALSKILDKNVKITNLDYSELLHVHEDHEDDENAEIEVGEQCQILIYLDPPYYSATHSRLYGKKGNLHSSFDHQRFSEEIKACKMNWFISYDNSKFVRELFSFAKQYAWQLQYGMNNPNKDSCLMGEELIVSGFNKSPLTEYSSQPSLTQKPY